MNSKSKRFMRTSSTAGAMLARQFGIQISVEAIEEKFDAGEFKNLKDLTRFFERSGVKLSYVSMKRVDLITKNYLFPCVAILKSGQSVIITAIQSVAESQTDTVSYVDPLDPVATVETTDFSEFTTHWSGKILLVSRYTGHFSKDKNFDLNWFLPEFYRFRWLILAAFIMSLILHGLALSPIVYIQIALDKVLGYSATSTLYVLTGAVCLALIFNGLLTYARDYIIAYISTTIEARLTGDVFDKLLELPLHKFQTSDPGSLESGVGGAANVRNF